MTASLLWIYSDAATLASWTVTRLPEDRWSLTATVVASDAFRVTQRPLTFEAPHAQGVWRWPVLELQIGDGGALSATLGPIEG